MTPISNSNPIDPASCRYTLRLIPSTLPHRSSDADACPAVLATATRTRPSSRRCVLLCVDRPSSLMLLNEIVRSTSSHAETYRLIPATPVAIRLTLMPLFQSSDPQAGQDHPPVPVQLNCRLVRALDRRDAKQHTKRSADSVGLHSLASPQDPRQPRATLRAVSASCAAVQEASGTDVARR